MKGRGGAGADLVFRGSNGEVTLEREVKCLTGSAQGTFNREFNKASKQIGFNGDIFLQVPEGTNVRRFVSIFVGTPNRNLDQYKNVTIQFREPSGKLLYSGRLSEKPVL